jgi:SAM-dependent methyltransferase
VTTGHTYGPEFHREMAALARASAAAIVPIVLRHVQPSSVVDVGSGPGTWLGRFVEHGVDDVVGLDGEGVTTELMEIPEDRFRRVDLTDPPGLGRTFDLALCLEVAEHLPSGSADRLVGWLTSLAPVVLFSAAIPHQGGTGHRNEQWPVYWAERFVAHGFECLDVVRAEVWDDPTVQWWYAQNCLLYVSPEGRRRWPALPPGTGAPLALVHPRRFLEVIDWAVGEVRRAPSGRSDR